MAILVAWRSLSSSSFNSLEGNGKLFIPSSSPSQCIYGTWNNLWAWCAGRISANLTTIFRWGGSEGCITVTEGTVLLSFIPGTSVLPNKGEWGIPQPGNTDGLMFTLLRKKLVEVVQNRDQQCRGLFPGTWSCSMALGSAILGCYM